MDERGAVRVGGQAAHPGDTERLHEYWVHGPGAAKIRWGEPNDFERCVEHLGKFLADPKGYCNLAHKAATGMYPAQHAAMEKKATGRSQVTTPAGGYDADGLDGSWDGDCSDLPDLTGLSVTHFEAAEKAMGAAPPDSAQRAMPKLGTGARFKKLSASLAAKGARDPGALAAYIGRRKFGKAKFAKIAAKARGKGGASRMSEDRSQRLELFRSYPLEDAHVVTRAEGDGSGRLVEAYCAVFGEAAEIRDHQGHYEEDIDRAAFNKRIADVQRSRAGFSLVKCHYNHGLTIHGTPAERFSLPVAVPKHISAESRGVLTRSYYMDTPLGNEVLEMWREGAISAQSFTGAIIRSSPELRRGEQYRPKGGQLPRVTRLELGLKEYGPTPFPAYSGAELVGVRMSPLGTWQAARSDDEQYDEQEQALPPDGEAAADEPPPLEGKALERHHQHALYVLRSKEAREKAGLVWLQTGRSGPHGRFAGHPRRAGPHQGRTAADGGLRLRNHRGERRGPAGHPHRPVGGTRRQGQADRRADGTHQGHHEGRRRRRQPRTRRRGHPDRHLRAGVLRLRPRPGDPQPPGPLRRLRDDPQRAADPDAPLRDQGPRPRRGRTRGQAGEPGPRLRRGSHPESAGQRGHRPAHAALRQPGVPGRVPRVHRGPGAPVRGPPGRADPVPRLGHAPVRARSHDRAHELGVREPVAPDLQREDHDVQHVERGQQRRHHRGVAH